MKYKLALALAAATPMLAACPGPLQSPGQVAQHTVADEQMMLRAEQAYKLARTIGEIAVDAGLLRGENAARAAELDNQMFAALGVARSAYAAFNSEDLAQAVQRVTALADQVETLVHPQQ